MIRGMRLISCAVVAVVALAGCAPGFRRAGPTGGYSDLQVDEGTWIVRYDGNAFTPPQPAAEMAWLRSAQLATQNGFRYFVVAEAVDTSTVHSYAQPTQTNTRVRSSYGGTYEATTTHSGGGTVQHLKPGTALTIVCFKERPDGVGFVYDAERIKTALMAKYRL